MATATNAALGSVKLAGDLQAGDALNPALVPSGVVPGEYPTIYKIHVDSKGRTVWVSGEPEEVKEDVPLASTTVVGSVKPGHNINYANNTIDVNKTSSVLLGIAKLGAGLEQNELTGATDVVLPDASTTIYGKAKGDQGAIKVDGSGFMYVDPVAYCDEAGEATTSAVGFIKIGSGFEITDSEYLNTSLWPASSLVKGGVKVGTGFKLQDGFLRQDLATNSTAGTVVNALNNFYIDPQNAINIHATHYSFYGWLGGISGSNIYLDNSTHTLSSDFQFTDFSDVASASVLGKVQIGSNINVSSGLISVSDAVADVSKGVLKTTGRIFKIESGVLRCDYEYPASQTYFGGCRPDGTTVTFSDLANSVISVNLSSSYNIATTLKKGAVQIGDNISVNSGVISVPDATTTSLGLVQIGAGISVNDGVISTSYPTASATTLGVARLNQDLQGYTVNGLTTYYQAYGMTSREYFNNVLPDGTFVNIYNSPAFSYFTKSGLSYSLMQFHSALQYDASATGGVYIPCGGVYSNNSSTQHVRLSNGVISIDPTIQASETQVGIIKCPGGIIFGDKIATSSTNGIVKISSNSILWTGEPVLTPGDGYIGPGVCHINLASTLQHGVVKAGNGILISTDGVMSLQNATASLFGIMQPGNGLTIDGSGFLTLDNLDTVIINTAQKLKNSIIKCNQRIYTGSYPNGITINAYNDYNGQIGGEGTDLFYNISAGYSNYEYIQINIYDFDESFNTNLTQKRQYADLTNHDIKRACKVVNKLNTSTPVKFSLNNVLDMDGSPSAYYGEGCVPGDIILFTVKQFYLPGTGYGGVVTLRLKSAEIFKN